MKYDVIALLETHKDEHYDISIPGYQCFNLASKYRHPDACRATGGFLILVSNKYSLHTNVTKESDFLVWLVISSKLLSLGEELHIGFVYIPPEGSPHIESTGEPFVMLQDSVVRRPTDNVILCGDFNSRTGNLLDYIDNENVHDVFDGCLSTGVTMNRSNIDPTINSHGRKLVEFCKSTGLQIQNGRLSSSRFTCFRPRGKSAVDYVITSSVLTQYISSFCILDNNVNSDHSPLIFDLPTRDLMATADSTAKSCHPLPVVYRWDPSLQDTYRYHLGDKQATDMRDNLLCSIVCQEMNIDHIVGKFNECISYAAEKTFRKANINPRNKFPRNPWFDDQCKNLKATLHILGKNDGEGNHVYLELKRQYKALVQRKKRQFRQNLAMEVENLYYSDPKKYWEFWKKCKSRKRGNAGIDVDTFKSHYITSEKQSNYQLFDYTFMSLVEKFVEAYDNSTSIPVDGPLNDIMNAAINTEEVTTALKKAKTNKAVGVDGIPAELYKYSGGQLNETLVALFNCIFDQGIYPREWCEGIINPLFKKGSEYNPDHYRKITLISSLGKIFETVLNNRAKFANEALKMDDPFQNGFKDKARATDNVFMLNSLIDICAARKRPLYVCFIDFKSAFDFVNRSALLYKLYSRGIGGKFFNIIKSMYDNAKSRVKWNSQLSNIFENLRGVLQGGVLSPTLFKIFLDDLVDYLDKNKGVTVGDIMICYILFADDLVLVSETSTGLQHLLNGLEQFCKQWHMLVNLMKTNIMIFNKKYLVPDNSHDFHFNGSKIDETDHYNYVGTIFSNAPDRFGMDNKHKHDKALRAIFTAKRLARGAMGQHVPPRTFFRIFDTQIAPILEYGAEVWYGGKPIKSLETVHTAFVKHVLGVKKQTSNLSIYGESGRFPLEVRQQIMICKYWSRIITLDKDNPLVPIYNELRLLHNAGQKTWLRTAQNVLSQADVMIEFDENHHDILTLVRAGNFIRSCKDALISRFRDQWSHDINNHMAHPILRTYSLFKDQHLVEPYLLSNISYKFKRCIAKLRVSSHRLGIETGRHKKPPLPLNQRLCQYCSGSHIDDELHFVIRCQHNQEARVKLYEIAHEHIANFLYLTDLDKMIKIFQCESPEVIYEFGKFIYTSFQNRDTINFN